MQVNILRRFYWFVRGVFLDFLGIFFKKRPQPDLEQAKEVLIIALFRVGDAVYATPVFREMKRHHSGMSIDLVCRKYTADVFKNNPHLRNSYILQDGIFDFFRIKSIVKKNNYHLVIDLTSDDKIVGALLARLSSTPYCLGYNNQKRGFCLDRAIPLPSGELHATQIFLYVLEELRIPIHSSQPEMSVIDNEKEEMRSLIKKYDISDTDFLVGLHPGANFPSQRLRIKKWAQLCDSIQEKFHKKVIVFGGPKDLSLIEAVRQETSSAVIAIDKLPDLRAAVALIDRCDILLCNNSGPLHIAEAVGTPTLSWMGPTIPYRWYPLGPNHRVIRKKVDCAPCNKASCDHHQCSELITLEEMEREFNLLLEGLGN